MDGCYLSQLDSDSSFMDNCDKSQVGGSQEGFSVSCCQLHLTHFCLKLFYQMS